jgi:hypothetical protein
VSSRFAPPASASPRAFLRVAAHLLLALALLMGGASVSTPIPAQAEEERALFDPRFREGAPSDELAAGPPRLSRGHVNAFIDLFETAFDVALPAQSEQDLRDALEEQYIAADTAGRESFLTLVDAIAPMKARARCCDWRFVHGGLRSFRTVIDARLRAAPKEAANEVMLKVLRRRHEVVWRGEPALKALAVEAYLEMVVFVASLGRNETIRLSEGQFTALRDYLGKDLRRCTYATRNCLISVHRTWLRVKARWDRSRDSRRLGMRWEATHLLARLAPTPGGLQVPTQGSYKDYARAAATVEAADKAFDVVTALARNPQALQEALCRGLGLGAQAPPFPFLYR